MASEYLVQIVHADTGKVVSFAPGRKVEKELISDLRTRVEAKSVGLGRTAIQVGQAVEDAFIELLRELKANV